MRAARFWCVLPPAGVALMAGAIALSASSLCGACAVGPLGLRKALAILGFLAWGLVAAGAAWNRTVSLLCAAALVGAQAALWTLPALGPPCPLCGVVFALGVLAVVVLGTSVVGGSRAAVPAGMAAFLAVSVVGTAAGLGIARPQESGDSGRAHMVQGHALVGGARARSRALPWRAVTLLSPRCPTCREFAEILEPELRLRLGERYSAYWLFDPANARECEAVAAAAGLPSEALPAHGREALRLARAGRVSVVPTTLVLVEGEVVGSRAGADGIMEWLDGYGLARK